MKRSDKIAKGAAVPAGRKEEGELKVLTSR
jgi:hypothetical protein